MKKAAAAGLTLIGLLLLALAQGMVPGLTGEGQRLPPAPAEARASGQEVPRTAVLLPDGRAALDEEPSFHALPADPRLHRQVRGVITVMDRDGRPPAGVFQGGRRGRQKGLFENSEGRLPPRPRGYYVESDVWPRRPQGRGAERLVFGREGEVFYSPDHYRTFVRIR